MPNESINLGRRYFTAEVLNQHTSTWCSLGPFASYDGAMLKIKQDRVRPRHPGNQYRIVERIEKIHPVE